MLAIERFNNLDDRTIEEFFYGLQREVLNEMMDCAITLILEIMLESIKRTFNICGNTAVGQKNNSMRDTNKKALMIGINITDLDNIER